jgi:hypothetical protein
MAKITLTLETVSNDSEIGRENGLPCVLEDFSSQDDTVVCWLEGPYNPHRRRDRPDHTEIKEQIRENELVAALGIHVVDRHVRRCSDEEKNQEDS